MPQFPYTEVKAVSRWTNYCGTIPECAVPLYCTPDVTTTMGDDAPRKLRRTGDALSAIVKHCFTTQGATLRTVGSRWSFSNIIKPGNVVVDPANLNALFRVKTEWLNAAYRKQRPGFTPIFSQGGTHVGSLNRRLLDMDLALQTSGAGDGQRIAGCISTGTHGAAIDIGAMHDTVLGVHLLTAPGHSVFVQPKAAACSDEVAHWLQRETAWKVDPINDDELFHAAQVGLGSLGFVHGVVLETAPLYSLQMRIAARPFGDAEVWNMLTDLNTQRFHKDIAARPYHVEVVFHPYPSSAKPGAFVKLMWKRPAAEAPHTSPSPSAPAMASDMMGLIGKLSGAIDGSLPTLALRLFISEQLEKRYKSGDSTPRLPGMMFGPTSLPPGFGASTEVIVDQVKTRRALEVLYDVLGSEAGHGRHLLGAISVRFVPKTNATLGMNIHPMNAFIELPSVRNAEVLGIYQRYWDALAHEGIPFACHWGQLHGMNPARMQSYFGPRVERWKAARDKLLTDPAAKRVFSSPLLSELGLQ